MKPKKRNKVTFDDMPRMMSDLLDQMRTLTDRVKRLETPEGRPRTSSGREILTTMEVANMLKLARVTVYRMASRGDIPCYKSGKNLMFYRDEIEAWINNNPACNSVIL